MTRASTIVVTVALVLAGFAPGARAADKSPASVRSIVDDVQAYWHETLPSAYGQQYEPIPADRLYPYSAADPPPACGSAGTIPYEQVAGNAFYCSDGDFVAWDEQGLIPKLQQQFGDLAVALVFAHEWGHVIQQQTGTSAGSTIPLELQADCFAGAWTHHATTTEQDPFNLKRGDLDQALSGYLFFRDPTGTSPLQEGAHGSAFDRIAAFNDGYGSGAERCKNYATDPPIVTEVPFTSSSDAAREGNLPFGQLLTTVRKDLAAYWKSVLGVTPVTKLVASARRAERCAGRDARPVIACSGRIVAYAPKALRAVYDTRGDDAVATLLAEAWADAATSEGRLDRAHAPSGRAAECMAGAWAAALVNGSGSTDSALSPGDLDEAVSALLAFPGRSTPGNDAFVRFRAFRRGFVDGARKCGLSRASVP
jgi:predicted metalloprotease